MLKKSLSKEYEEKGYKKYRFVLLKSEEELIKEAKKIIEKENLFCPTNSALGKIIDIVTSEQKFWNQDFKRTLNDLKTIAYSSKQKKDYRYCDISCDFRTEQAYNLERIKKRILKITDENLQRVIKMKTTVIQIILHYFKKNKTELLEKIIPFNFNFKSKFLIDKNKEFLNSKIDIENLENNKEYKNFTGSNLNDSSNNKKWGYETIKIPKVWLQSLNNVSEFDIPKEKLENIFVTFYEKDKKLTDVFNMICRFDLKVPTERNIKTQENLHGVEVSHVVTHISPKVTKISNEMTFLLEKFYSSAFQKRTIIRSVILYFVYSGSKIVN